MIKINCTIDELTKDIKKTKDPLKKAILKKFIDIKTNEIRKNNQDPYIEVLSETMTDSDTIKEINNPRTNHTSENKDQKEIKSILKRQEIGLIELDKASKMKAYQELVNENNKQNDKNMIEKIRGKGENKWNNDTLNDPQYTKYVKEDFMNNKLMERLNTEIDFRHSEGKKIQIQKPFDENDEENLIDSFARFEPLPKISKTGKKPKQDNNRKQMALGQRRTLYQ